MEAIFYMLKTSLFLLGFFVLYELLLKKETMFTANRIYLLLTSVLALILPFVIFDIVSAPVLQDFTQDLPEIFLFQEGDIQTAPVSNVGLYGLFVVYVLIALIRSFMFFKKTLPIVRMLKQSPLTISKEVKVFALSSGQSAFTFLDNVFISQDLPSDQYEQIIDHEMVHVRQKHTWDLLWFEWYKIVFWFNPVVYLYQKRMVLLHEYLADEQIVSKTGKKQYINTLLNEKFNTRNLVFINSFYQSSQLKNRIIMMTQNKSRSTNLLKYLSIIPFVLIMLFVQNACNTDHPEKGKATTVPGSTIEKVETDQHSVKFDTEQDKEVRSDKKDNLPFSVIEEAPVFPGCTGSKEVLKKCFMDKVSKHVNDNFKTLSAKSLGLDSGTKYRISVMFTVDKHGQVTKIKARAPHESLEQEAIRVIKLLPQMTPGKYKDEPINVTYALPILFVAQN
ncbi:MAG: hypothetical protein CR968_02750 [Flavobacteriia bacterium]|nr:MAG: hypothetical protein CR968_02750 [Flavobacteriia bacterium]